MPHLVLASLTVPLTALIVACAIVGVAALQRRAAGKVHVLSPAQAPFPPRVIRGSVPCNVIRRSALSVEGLEIQYDRSNLVRSVCVGAMNSEHKELLLTMDAVQWQTLTNAGKQEVLAAARSTWAAKMCSDGPDVAALIVKTDDGTVVGRADPHSVTLV